MQHPPETEADRARKKAQDLAEAARDGKNFIVSIVMIVFTGLAAGVVGWQAWEARKATDIARETLKIANRAFLGARVYIDQLNPGSFRLCAEWKNVGHAPATITARRMDCVVRPEPPPEPTPPPWEPYSAVVFPDTASRLTTTFNVTDQADAPHAALWDSIRAGTLTLVVWGGVRYDAGCGVEGESGFALIYAPKADGPEGHRFIYAPTHNYAK